VVVMMMVVVTMVVLGPGEHWACKRQQQNCCKNLLHGDHPKTHSIADRRTTPPQVTERATEQG